MLHISFFAHHFCQQKNNSDRDTTVRDVEDRKRSDLEEIGHKTVPDAIKNISQRSAHDEAEPDLFEGNFCRAEGESRDENQRQNDRHILQ
mgnify:CR=1 FL=1